MSGGHREPRMTEAAWRGKSRIHPCPPETNNPNFLPIGEAFGFFVYI